MGIVTVTDFNAYTGNYEESDLKQYYLDSAESIVSSYLGYDIECQEYDETIEGLDAPYLILNALPIESVDSITEKDGTVVDYDEDDVEIKAEKVTVYDDDTPVTFSRGTRYRVVYTAGYDDTTIPGLVKLTVLRIASLLITESSGNIGITAKSFGDAGSKTFVNYTNFAKYLEPISTYRLVKLW